MKNKGTALIAIILVILAVIVIAAGAYYLGMKNAQTPTPASNTQIQPPSSFSPSSRNAQPSPVNGTSGNTTTNSTLASLPIMFPVWASTEIANYFNTIARPTDVAIINYMNAQMIPSITKGQKMVVFPSWITAQTQLSTLKGQVQIIAYDPEHWGQTPSSEQTNLVATVQQAQQQAHQYGFTFLVVPDVQFDMQYASQIAPYADLYIIQGQNFQRLTSTYQSSIGRIAQMVHSANAKTQIWAQVTTSLSVDQMITDYAAVQNNINGMAFWENQAGFPTLQQYISAIRP